MDPKTLESVKIIIEEIVKAYSSGNNSISLWSIVIALFGLVLSGISFFRSNAYTKGTVEIYIRNMITTARNNQLQAIIEAAKLDSDKDKELIKNIIDSSTEDLLNAYDEACAKFNDAKVDKERFKKLYTSEIIDIYKNNKTYIKDSENYKALEKTYKILTNKECWL